MYASHRVVIKAHTTGYVNIINTKGIGLVSCALGAGRTTKTDPIDYDAGIYLMKQHGDYVNTGDVIAYLCSNQPISNELTYQFYQTYSIVDEPCNSEPMVLKILSTED